MLKLDKLTRALPVFSLSLIASIFLCAKADAGDWPMFLKDKEHSSYAEKAPRPPYALKWRFETKGPVYSSPIVYKNRVYAGSYDKTLYAIDSATGKAAWTFASGGEILGAPAALNGVIYFGSKDGKIYALDANTGKPLWEYETEGKVLTSVLADGTAVYAGASDLFVYALNAAKDAPKGRRLWRMRFADNEFLGGVYSTPALFEGSVIVAGRNGMIYASDAKSGGRNWSKRTDSAIYSSVSIKEGVVYVSSYERKLYAFEAKTGKMLWGKDLGDIAYASPVVAGGKVYIALKNGRIKIFDKAKGAEKADFKVCDGAIDSTPALTAGGTLIAGCSDGSVYALDADSGALLWSYSTGGGVRSSPAVTEDGVYIGSLDGSIYAFGR